MTIFAPLWKTAPAKSWTSARVCIWGRGAASPVDRARFSRGGPPVAGAASRSITTSDSGVRRTTARMEALHTVGFAAYFQGDYSAMQANALEWLAIAEELEDERAIWMARDMLARVWMNQGDYVRAKGVFTGQLGAMRRLGQTFGIASALVGLGVVARLQGDHPRAVAWCEECLALSFQPATPGSSARR